MKTEVWRGSVIFHYCSHRSGYRLCLLFSRCFVSLITIRREAGRTTLRFAFSHIWTRTRRLLAACRCWFSTVDLWSFIGAAAVIHSGTQCDRWRSAALRNHFSESLISFSNYLLPTIVNPLVELDQHYLNHPSDWPHVELIGQRQTSLIYFNLSHLKGATWIRLKASLQEISSYFPPLA